MRPISPPRRAKRPQSARISSDGPIACLVSQPLLPPGTGRITMSVWLRVADAARQPNLRLAVEGKLARPRLLSLCGHRAAAGARAGRKAHCHDLGPVHRAVRRSAAGRSFPDARPRGSDGRGEVWADDVQLFDLAFNESELRALYKLLTLADLNLQNGQVGDCLKLLNGYWPRFLVQNVPLPPAVPALAAKPADPGRPSDDKPAEPQPSSWTDRVKGSCRAGSGKGSLPKADVHHRGRAAGGNHRRRRGAGRGRLRCCRWNRCRRCPRPGGSSSRTRRACPRTTRSALPRRDCRSDGRGG